MSSIQQSGAPGQTPGAPAHNSTDGGERSGYDHSLVRIALAFPPLSGLVAALVGLRNYRAVELTDPRAAQALGGIIISIIVTVVFASYLVTYPVTGFLYALTCLVATAIVENYRWLGR